MERYRGLHYYGICWLLTASFTSWLYVKATIRHVRETSSDKGLFFPSYTHFIYTNHSE